MLYSLLTKLPSVGPFIEVYQVHQEYQSNVDQIKKNYNRIGLIAKDLESKSRSSIYASTKKNLINRVDAINSKMHDKKNDISREKQKACGGICLIVLQETANALFYGGGAIVAGIASAAQRIFCYKKNLHEDVILTGINAGMTDLAYSTIVDIVLKEV